MGHNHIFDTPTHLGTHQHYFSDWGGIIQIIVDKII